MSWLLTQRTTLPSRQYLMFGTVTASGASSVCPTVTTSGYESSGLPLDSDIDNTNIIQEVWASNYTQGWALGPLSAMNISPMDDDQVGMVACWHGPTSPDEYAEGYATTTDASQLAIRLVYATDATTFQELSYQGSTQLWTSEQTLSNLNGHTTPACYNRGQGTVDYLMVADLHKKINVYWYVYIEAIVIH